MSVRHAVVWLVAAPLAGVLFWQTQGCSYAAPPFHPPDGAYNNVSPWQESNDEKQEACAKAILEAAQKQGVTNKAVILVAYKRCLRKLEVFV